MLVDLRYFEFARMVDMLPFSVDEKKKILPAPSVPHRSRTRT